ncbi:hypothetical protein YTPLAS18_36620 [Nitrospira sp.]|nr:hypothetical protein YTPLAS18_36620 [Nitrospira sp.]
MSLHSPPRVVIQAGRLIVASSALWWGVSGAFAEAGHADKGRSIFMESCQHCHGAKGDGQSELAAYLTPPPANLLNTATQSKTDEQLRTIILEGRTGTAMAGFEGALDDTGVADVIAYIRSLSP